MFVLIVKKQRKQRQNIMKVNGTGIIYNICLFISDDDDDFVAFVESFTILKGTKNS